MAKQKQKVSRGRNEGDGAVKNEREDLGTLGGCWGWTGLLTIAGRYRCRRLLRPGYIFDPANWQPSNQLRPSP